MGPYGHHWMERGGQVVFGFDGTESLGGGGT